MAKKVTENKAINNPEDNELREKTLLEEDSNNGVAADGGADTVAPTARFQIRAAISSIYGAKQDSPLDNDDWAKIAEKLPKAQAEAMLKEAKALAKEGDKDKALQLLAQAVRIDPESSEAWTWMGGLLMAMEGKLDRAKFCLTRALEIDAENERAKRGLEQIEALLNPPQTSLAVIEETALAATKAEEVRVDKTKLKIGLDEALHELRRGGRRIEAEAVPLGGARLRALAEREGLKFPRIKPPKAPFKLPFLPQKGLKLSLVVLFIMVLITAAGFFVILTQAPSKTALDSVASSPTAIPTATLTTEENFAFRMRGVVDGYFGFFASVKDLRQKFDTGRIRWDELRSGYKKLQGDARELKKQVDALANKVTAKLLPAYKRLQEIALVAITGADFMVSGVDNVLDEDLNEGTRQFSRANSLLLDLGRLIESIVPLPTATPVAPPTPTETAAPTPTPTATPESLTVTPNPTNTSVPQTPAPENTPPPATPPNS